MNNIYQWWVSGWDGKIKPVSISVRLSSHRPRLPHLGNSRTKIRQRKKLTQLFWISAGSRSISLTLFGEQYPMKTISVCCLPDKTFPEKQSSTFSRLPTMEFLGCPLKDLSFSLKIWGGRGTVLSWVEACCVLALPCWSLGFSVMFYVSSEQDLTAIRRPVTEVVLKFWESVPENPKSG